MYRAIIKLLVLAMVILSIAGCSQLTAATEVTGQRLVDTIVKQVGDLEVKRQEVANAIEGAKQEVERLKVARIENAVQAELLRTQTTEMQDKLDGMKIEMDKLADYIDAGQPLQLSDGSEVGVDQLRSYAADLITNYDTVEQTLAAKLQALALHDENIRLADQRTTDGLAVIRQLESQVEIIDAQVDTLKVFTDRPELLVDAGEDRISQAQALVSETSAILTAQIAAWKAETPGVPQSNVDISAALQGDGQEDTTVGDLRKRAGTEPTIESTPVAKPAATATP